MLDGRTMPAPPARPMLPRGLPLAVGAVLVAALLAVWLWRIDPDNRSALPPGVPSAQLDLRFEDRPGGAIAVLDAARPEAAPLTLLPAESNHFLRSTLRALVRERRQDRLGPEAPFRLSSWPAGQLTLEDRATGRILELRAFGETNAAVFAKFLDPQENR